jgi:predicted TPR repeat methyltransferase
MASVSTFQNYDSNQAACFARRRRSYSSAVYEVIVNYHIANGGQFHRLLDVGCGSGGSTRGLASYFDLTVGVDLGRELILQARAIGGETKTGKSIQYEIGSAENVSLARTVEDGSVDLLLVGMAVFLIGPKLTADADGAGTLVQPGGILAKGSASCQDWGRGGIVDEIFSLLP